MTENAPLRVEVPLGARAYAIEIGSGLIEAAGGKIAALRPGARVGIVTDDNVAAAHLGRLVEGLKAHDIGHAVVTIPAGEGSKSWSRLEAVVDGLLEARLERGDLVVALGGGVVGDLAGFAASITRRGMDMVQIPTSLLAQVDSSVGGKTGINARQGKNLVGAFHQPVLVLADLDALDTLPERQFRAGYAEIAKYGLIDDPELFFWLEANAPAIFSGGPERGEAVARSCAAKARVVVADETEQGERALLNLGHTFGHALEKATGFSDRLLHGEGVAIGMVMAHDFSVSLGLCPGQDAARVRAHLSSVGLPTRLSEIAGETPSTAVLMEAIAQDKKVSRGALTFILTRGIGRAFVEKAVDGSAVQHFLEDIR